jgi:cytochrome c biogenesis protein CcmG/thiol:disulfide interchange protein DsbE
MEGRMRSALLALAFLSVTLALIPASHAFAAVDVGQPAPALVARELSGKAFDLAAQRGKVVIINFWATWCPPCRKEMPILDAFYREHHSQGLEMIGISVDRPHDSTEVHNVMQSYSYPAAMSEDAQVNEFGSPDTVPLTFVVDSKGIVRAKLTPDETALTEKILAAAVLPLLAQRTATGTSLNGDDRGPKAGP